MTAWTIWNTEGQRLSEREFTEESARQILLDNPQYTMLAKNAAGDEITKHDGPIHVGRVKTDDLQD